MSDWAGEYFERGYTQRWGLLPVTERIRRETSGLLARLQLSSRARVVDVGCGHGRYALAFAEQGADVVGVDSAVTLLMQIGFKSLTNGRRIHPARGKVSGV
jgi:2-polyprenyl-3-methyl-5-hydroxy-6-metoxy-1,4-benzoquinol methylase